MTDKQLVWLTVYAAAVAAGATVEDATSHAFYGSEEYARRFGDPDPAPPPRPELPTMPEVG